MAHVQYIKIQTWLQGFRVHCLAIPKGLEDKENQTKYRKMTRKPQSQNFDNIEHGLFKSKVIYQLHTKLGAVDKKLSVLSSQNLNLM